MKVIKLFIVSIACLSIGGCQIDLSKQCFNLQPGDSNSFGASLAMSDNYLAVGDPKANRVVIYSRNDRGKWFRSKNVLPPKDSAAYKFGSGFGFDVSLDQYTLVIGSFTKYTKKEVNSSKDLQQSFSNSFAEAVYQTKLDREIKVDRIDAINKEVIFGSLVDADLEKQFFLTSQKEQIQQGKSIVNVLFDGNIIRISEPKNNQNRGFGFDIAINNNLLLVAAPSINKEGGAWLFDLDNLKKETELLSAPNVLLGTTIAISDQFAVVGESLPNRVTAISSSSSKTMIKALKSNNTMFIDGYGTLSLDGNILTRMHHAIAGTNDSTFLEIFYLYENAQPRLIKKQKNVSHALVKNNLLTTIQNTNTGKKLCIKPVI
ncbi:conserved hypothetical protein [Hyella patelloides LEGE 07179]|uniref:Lipoprotein n=1 Tax=Hyella patelloides LEGE 07179 TaxID=945734 RepID=A0A563VVM3_9CYAN|nr:hypothetical protein [Hyella patelloides]VEP15451.1 conserved hypothetical protein [Hyella patelloides LEGE 07179]